MSIYTDNPGGLLGQETFLFLRLTLDICHGSLGSIVWPIWPAGSSLDELGFKMRNIWSILVHAGLIIVQLAFLLFVAAAPFFAMPTPLYFGALLGGVFLNMLVCSILLNGCQGHIFYAGRQFSAAWNDRRRRLESVDPRHHGERWVFINGVAAGSHWARSNLDRIAKTFRRPILGVHNSTYGIIFDVIECCLQRTLSYPTLDIRVAYEKISELLRDPDVTKLVLVAHSQGAIETGMVLDWCLATLSHTNIAKIELYTFGNASNHCNSPEIAPGRRAIQHVEHYVNRYDWVARFGVLSFRGVERGQPPAIQTRAARGFVGKLFIRPAKGHQMNQHYLNNMFTMDAAEANVLNDNDFMNTVIDRSNFLDYNGLQFQLLDAQGRSDPPTRFCQESRLWKYRNGYLP